MKLRCETNTPAMEKRILRAAWEHFNRQRRRLSADFEHGQWWITDLNSGAQWSVHDLEPGGFDFEQVTRGEEE